MKNIEKQADLFGMDDDDGFAVMNDDKRDGFKAGAEWMRQELTRWNDPNDELPDDDRDVLVKTTLCREYRIAFYKANGARNYHWHENNGAFDDDMVLGWREIHE